MHYLKGIKKTISLIALTAFILVNSVYAAPNHNSLRPILKSNGLIAYDPAHTPADDTSYRIFCKGVNDHINTHPVDPYAPLQGTPLLRRKTAELVNREVLQGLSLQISSDDVTISLGTTGLLELFSRIFCNIERAALKSKKERDSVALSKCAKPLYSQKSVFGRAVGLNAEKPRMMVIAAEDIEEGKLKNLLAQAQKNNTVVVFLDNDSSHRNISQVYNLLNQYEAYRANTVIITDISMRFGLAEYNVGAFVTFNKAIINAYNAAAGGSIAAVSQNTQAGFQRLIDSQLGPAAEAQEAGEIKAVNNPKVINSTFINMEPDPTLAISPVGMLDKHGLPQIFRDPNSAFQKTLRAALGLPPEQVLHIPTSNYEKGFAKAQNLGILAKLEESDRRYTEELFKQLGEFKFDREAFSQRLLEEPNSEIVEILQQALGQQQLDAYEIMALWSVFNVKKMHVGAPGFARDETAMAALRLPEERLTPEQLKEIEKKLLNAGIFFANNVFGLSFDKGNVASGFYGSKPVEQDVLTALQLINNKDIAIAVPKPYYVGYRSSILGAGIPLRNISFFNTRTSNNWVPTPDEAKKAFDKLSPGTQKVLLLTTPDNPSGTAVPQDAIEKLLEFAVHNDAFIIFDVAYARLLFEGKPADLRKICENIFSRLDEGFKREKGINSASDLTKHFLIMQTQSKEILHPSPRLGAAMSGNTVLIQKLREIKIFDADPIAKKAQTIIYGESHAEYVERYIQQHNAYLKRNVNHICAVLDELGIHYVRPQGAFYILFRIGKGPYIRFSFAGPFADIVQVMARIERSYPEWKEKDADITSDDLFKETAITSVSGNAFGAPEIKAVEDAEDVAEFIESRSVCGFIAPQQGAEKLIDAIVTGNNSRFGVEIAFRGDDRNRVLELIRFAVKKAEKIQSKTIIAAGTVLNKGDALDAIEAGARLIVAPGLTLSKKDIDEIHQKGAMVMMGAGSKDEALEAVERGADVIKVFPFNPKEHMEALKGPLPVDLHPYLEKVVIIGDDLDMIEFTTAGDVKLATFTNIYEFLQQKPTEEGYFILPKSGKGLVNEVRALVSDKPIFITDGVTAELIGDGLLNTLDVGTALLITSLANIDEILWLVNASEEAKNLASQIKKALKGPFSISRLSSLDGIVDTIVMRKPDVCKELLQKGAPKTVAAYIIERLALPNVARGASSNIRDYIEIAKGNPDIKNKAFGVHKMVVQLGEYLGDVPFVLPEELEVLATRNDYNIIDGITSIRKGDESNNSSHISYLSPEAWHDFVELMRRDSKINDVTKPPQTTILEQHPNANQYFYVEEGELVILTTDVTYHGLRAYVVRKGEIVKVGANVFHIAVNKTRNTKFWVYNEDPNTYQKVAKVETTITCIGRRFEIPDTFETDPVILARSELPINI